MPYEIGFPRILTSGAFLNHNFNRQTSHELQKNLDSRCIHFVHPVEKDSSKRDKLATQNSVSFTYQKTSFQILHHFPHELTCQILTNQSIKMKRRA